MGRAREIADLIGGTTPDIILKTSDGAILNLQTSDTTVTADSVLGAINFQAPDEASGTDSILLGAGIDAVAEGTFSASSNATKLSFKTAASAAAAETMALSSAGNLTVAGTINSTGAITANAGVVVDNITIDGTEIDLSSGDLTIDVAGDISLDYGGGQLRLKGDGTEFANLENNSSDFKIVSIVQDKDIIFRGNDGGSFIDPVTIDMSAAGAVGLNTSPLGIGISERLTIAGNATNQPRIKFSKADSASTDDEFGRIIFNNSANTDLASIGCISASGNTESSLVFHSGGGNTERMRLDNSGRLLLATTSVIASSNVLIQVNADGGASRAGSLLSETSFTDDVFHIHFRNGNGGVGGIKTNGSTTTYVTSSDYRLKENIITDWDATTRLKQLKPSRFNFKADKDTTLDGFLAHEVSSIVPEAITGIKDETQDLGTIKDKDGNVLQENVLESEKQDGQTWTKTKTEIVYQGIDQSKLVPLLVKTIQELEARIATLESK